MGTAMNPQVVAGPALGGVRSAAVAETPSGDSEIR
jgi:hypothetical protein